MAISRACSTRSGMAMLALLLALAVLAQQAAAAENVTQIIQGYGYPCDDYVTTTEDGWVLSLQRITHGRNSNSTSRKGVVFVQHGLLGSSTGWVLNAPNESLPLMLADAGYEVWLGNNRGNMYSDVNLHYKPSDAQYWAWSWDQMAKYDLDAMLSLALKVSGASQLTYFGHSQGTIQAWAGFSTYPELAKKVNLFVGLAPIIYLEHISNKLLQTLVRFHFEIALEELGVHEFLLEPEFLKKNLPIVCKLDEKLCDNLWDSFTGDNCCLNVTREPFYLEYIPQPTAVQNMAHMAQEVRSGNFQFFDYGSPDANKKAYNQTTPPKYSVKNFPLPVALFHGGIDQLADPTDYAHLRADLPDSVVKFEKFIPTFGHFDFVLSPQAASLIYEPAIQFLDSQL